MADVELRNILSDLGLSNYIPSFEREKITTDLVPKLSLQEFQVLGISNRRDMMNLRIKCSTFNTLAPNIVTGEAGAPKFDIPKEILSNLLDEDFTIKEISRLLGVSERTTYRRNERL